MVSYGQCAIMNTPGKLAIAGRLRRETILPVGWIAGRLQMGTRKSALTALQEWERAIQTKGGQNR